MFSNKYLKNIILILLCDKIAFSIAQNEYATNNITDSFDFSIGYIDKTADDAEIGSYDIIITNKYNFDTTIICRNIHYIDDNALKCSDNKLFYISTGLSLVVYDIFTKSYDTICNSYRGRFYLNSFLLMPNNHILLAAVNYQSEKIVFVELDFLKKKIIRKCSICEKNVGLEFLRINMQCAGEDVVNVKTTQCEYQISLKKRMYVKVHKVVESVSP